MTYYYFELLKNVDSIRTSKATNHTFPHIVSAKILMMLSFDVVAFLFSTYTHTIHFDSVQSNDDDVLKLYWLPLPLQSVFFRFPFLFLVNHIIFMKWINMYILYKYNKHILSIKKLKRWMHMVRSQQNMYVWCMYLMCVSVSFKWHIEWGKIWLFYPWIKAPPFEYQSIWFIVWYGGHIVVSSLWLRNSCHNHIIIINFWSSSYSVSSCSWREINRSRLIFIQC